MQSSGRGVDNTPEGWMTDYLISVLMLLFAVRLRSRGASAHAAVAAGGAGRFLLAADLLRFFVWCRWILRSTIRNRCFLSFTTLPLSTSVLLIVSMFCAVVVCSHLSSVSWKLHLGIGLRKRYQCFRSMASVPMLM